MKQTDEQGELFEGSQDETESQNESIDYKARNETLQKQLKDLGAKVAKSTEAQKKREAKTKEEAEQKRVEEDGAKSLLTEKNKELEDLQSRFETLEKAEQNRGVKLFEGLPEESRLKLGSLKEKLSASDWVELLEKESQFATSDDKAKAPMPPPTGSTMSRNRNKGDRYTPTPDATEILDEFMMRDDSMLRELTHKKRPDGTSVFTIPTRDFFAKMTKTGAYSLDREAAVLRKRIVNK